MSIAPSVLSMVALKGKLVTGDALYCQKSICQQIVEEGGDYLVIVKGNQPTVYNDIALVFESPPVGEGFTYAEQHSLHGDRSELRRLWASKALNGYLDWPCVGQVCKIERKLDKKGLVSIEARYAITSLGSASPQTLLRHIRGHWGIENRLHYVRDVTLGEDASQVRSAAAPQVMAALRNVSLNILRLAGVANVAASLRHNAWQPGAALLLLGITE